MMPYKTALHACVLAWLKNRNAEAFRDGKPTPAYFFCRNALLKFDLLTVENILEMLKTTGANVPVEHLLAHTQSFMQAKNGYAGAKEYNIDLKAFLSRNERR